MPFRYSPYNMYRLLLSILLERQYTGTFWIVWIILYKNCLRSTLNNLPSKEIIR